MMPRRADHGETRLEPSDFRGPDRSARGKRGDVIDAFAPDFGNVFRRVHGADFFFRGGQRLHIVHFPRQSEFDGFDPTGVGGGVV